MASQGPPAGAQPFNPQQIQQMIAMEAQKRGMTIPQFQAFQRQQIEQEAAKAGMSPQQFVQMKQEEARRQYMQQQQAMQQQQQQQQAQGQGQQAQGQRPPQGQVQQMAVNLNQPVEPTPPALAVAKFLRSQDLKTRTCIFNGERKDMFKVKRAFRALNSDAYKKAQKKNPLLPKVENDIEARTALQLLPLNMLALRVSKKDPHEGHNHAPAKKEKRVKGLWHVKIEQQQDFEPMMHYVWVFEPPQWRTRILAAGVVIAVLTMVCFPLWPPFLRLGAWYLSVGAMGLTAVFFAMSIFRLILFILTFFLVPPGLWLYPNLFEDVGFFDSFRPLWGWHETKDDIKRKKQEKKAKKAAKLAGKLTDGGGKSAEAAPKAAGSGPAPTEGSATTSSAEAVVKSMAAKRHAAPTVEEADEE
ncbi:uncharacterized protein PV06_04057 [Exophiala oligosperma]|uniref:Translocation protein SEC62 n=1 Tax=Exophiala oligosperma TaxID=215243 RepID=A0A0D2B0Q6_9EURO|nr:uncharacterized protein PV06_04057 [Exophiala oligosperma]KIW45686.1 hypothetical protein PV06_04057 [Exophiala oligosperma]